MVLRPPEGGGVSRFEFNVAHRYSTLIYLFVYAHTWGDLRAVNCFSYSPTVVTVFHKI